MIPIVNERNGRGRRDEKDREEAKKRNMSKRIGNRIIRDSHSENTQQQCSWNDFEKT
jgi:hypothetical protein